MRYLMILACLALGACTSNSYVREDGTRVTVKRFAGIPYLEEDVSTEVVPLGSPANPI